MKQKFRHSSELQNSYQFSETLCKIDGPCRKYLIRKFSRCGLAYVLSRLLLLWLQQGITPPQISWGTGSLSSSRQIRDERSHGFFDFCCRFFKSVFGSYFCFCDFTCLVLVQSFVSITYIYIWLIWLSILLANCRTYYMGIQHEFQDHKLEQPIRYNSWSTCGFLFKTRGDHKEFLWFVQMGGRMISLGSIL